MEKYINKKVQIREKVFSNANFMSANAVGIITNIYDKKFIELDNNTLISMDFIYMIKVVD